MSIPELPVIIKVKTTIDQQDTFELTVFGRYYKKRNASFLRYEEVMEEGSVRTIVKVSAADEALILRSGAVKMRLPFRLDQTVIGSYEMPFGRFEATTTAKRMEFGDGLIDILYDFTLQGARSGTYHLEISYQEDKQ